MKIVLNCCAGEYCLSKKAYNFLGLKWDSIGYAFSDDRTNPRLVECVEELGDAASGIFADLRVFEILDDVDCVIESNMGVEFVCDKNRTWGRKRC